MKSQIDPIDPITLEVQWNRLIAIMDEVDAAIVRTSFSTIVGDSRDFACILLDQHGRSLCQSHLSSPAFTVTLPTTTKHFLRRFPVPSLESGDVLITNDPWLASGHLPDLSICTPVFHRDQLVAVMGAVAHISDLGGRINYLEDQDLFEEGLRIPPAHLVRHNEPNELLLEIIEQNSRAPGMVLGDIHAIINAQALGARQLLRFLDDYEMPNLDQLADTILARSEAAMRAAIRELPDGTYDYALSIDGHHTPIDIQVTVAISGEDVVVDFSGSSPEQPDCSINCVYNNTFADTYYPLKCSLVPELPNNEGLFRPLRVEAPLGSVFNTRLPRAVRARSKVCFHIHTAIYGALASVMPQRIQAGSGSFWSFTAFGTDSDGQAFRSHFLPNGGKGACLGEDGLPTIAFPYNGTATPVEILENTAPLLLLRKELISDSGGPGQFRGGLGQAIAMTPATSDNVQITLRPDKLIHPPLGLLGGLPGRPGAFRLNDQDVPLDTIRLEPGQVLELELPGGGGIGDPGERDRQWLTRDIAEGYVSTAAADERYRNARLK